QRRDLPSFPPPRSFNLRNGLPEVSASHRQKEQLINSSLLWTRAHTHTHTHTHKDTHTHRHSSAVTPWLGKGYTDMHANTLSQMHTKTHRAYKNRDGLSVLSQSWECKKEYKIRFWVAF